MTPSLARLLCGAALAVLATTASSFAQADPAQLNSPDGRLSIRVETVGGKPALSVLRDGRAVIAPSDIGLTLENRVTVGANETFVAAPVREGVDDYALLGRASHVRSDWREMTLSAPAGDGRPAMQVVLRAYDDGVAFRYRVPAGSDAPMGVVSENTQFAFPADYDCWGVNLGRFNSSHEGEFDPISASHIREYNAYDAPLVCETVAGGPTFAIAEADLKNYPGLYLAGRGDGGLGVQAKLAPRLDAPTSAPAVVATARIGQDLETPWRVVMVGDHAGDLIESTMITDLSEPAAFDASWVKPGKSAWDWWNGGKIAAVPDSGMNTATFKAFIDFAAANGLQYVTIDEGWYRGSGGGGVVRPGVDVTQTVPEIDIPGLVAYGRSKGVGLFLWLNWKALDAQFDAALDQYQAWGIAGIKVDFMDRDDQQMVDWYHRLLERAAQHRLMVNLHGAFHPTGLTRTYPNFVTQEGVLGAENNKWSSRITAEHNVTLAYTRMLLGPMDYTPGGFDNQTPETFRYRFLLPTVMTTRAHGLAMFVVYESPLQTVADTPNAYAGQQETAFIAQVPTTWDETRFIAGEIGQSIVLARRKGRDWYVGAMTDAEGRTVSLPLDFLGRGRFTATIYADGDAPNRTAISTQAVEAGTTLSLALKPSGGAAIRITPR
ncbi:glycoside hydrolase family 97 protein [Brevundimonas intermedia]|uniref:Glycoside hydrolase family 97 protein n=1 Tax=Brevundimonas intermedia TaxID=74315 RepID=A0A4Y9S1B2_9CAUL|nr:glycoside hydrolase family 97 protein [Brevundimonas intermedia]TFW15287.1 glycoside hydrolase family 97 protein [Brevundimonas intermedia]